MSPINKKKIETFQKKILDRYKTHKRELPWRDAKDPYHVFVSEIMLQQTQVDRVIPKFLAWLHVLPTIQDLANVEKTRLLHLRSGLWFNSRAIRLQQAAQKVVSDFKGRVPKTREELLTLPGIWPYTSASILAFAYNIAAPVVDTNIRRVLMRELGIKEELSKLDLEDLASRCIPEWRSNDWHNALMDYGSLVATAKFTGIKPLSKQSKFEWSARQVRGKLLKYLLTHWVISQVQIEKLFPHDQLDELISWMVRDGIIKKDKNTYLI